ncbi:two-component system response regulator [Amphibiibacter pelophylacis]|uniref:EAL domain-containing protein n=1 Tax=Amphibiibacter pelophylacis TaxID=1799477 RepID=A0ACC6P417_9BURK
MSLDTGPSPDLAASGAGPGELLAAGERLLLVDDDPTTLLLTQATLSHMGFSVHCCTTGQSALNWLREHPVDLVILDGVMPGLDGFATCGALRGMPGLERIPVLMLTALDDARSVHRAWAAGATDFFPKHPNTELLKCRLLQMLHADRLRRELERSHARLARSQDLARMGSFDWTPEGRFDLSPAAQALLVLPDAHPGLRSLLRRVTVQSRHDLMRYVRGLVAQRGVIALDAQLMLDNGREVIMHIEAEPQPDGRLEAGGYTGIVQDVTDRRAAEDRIRQLSNFDALTGLPNRRQLLWRTQRSLDYARSQGSLVGLLLVNLDRFRVINDTLGHMAGDELLLEVSRRLRGCVRHIGDMQDGSLDFVPGLSSEQTYWGLEAVGRMGGDEFAILLPDVGSEQGAAVVAARVVEAMREPVLIDQQEYFVSASVGIALFPRDGATAAELFHNADQAMGAAKDRGRTSQMYAPHVRTRGQERLKMEAALHKAIERGEMLLHYQPKIDTFTGHMSGSEALLRWNFRNRLVLPTEFIPLAEESGLIEPISEWVLAEAARQARLWRDEAGYDDSIAVNLPSRMFEREDLLGTVRGLIERQSLGLHNLQLEITETSVMKNLAQVYQLSNAGVGLSIDDFGTGYSSLAYMTRLPVSLIKIDRSFVRDLGLTAQSQAVVNTVIALGHALNLRVLAEGVETLEQMRILRRLGCYWMQGFLFAPPMSASDFLLWRSQVLLAETALWQAELRREAGPPPMPPRAETMPQVPPAPVLRLGADTAGGERRSGDRRSDGRPR